MEHRCSICMAENKNSKLLATLDGSPGLRICAGCYFIAIDLGYAVVYVDEDAKPPLPGNLIL